MLSTWCEVVRSRLLLVTGAPGLACAGLSEGLWGHEHTPWGGVMAEASGSRVPGLRPFPHAAESPCLSRDSFICELGTGPEPGPCTPMGVSRADSAAHIAGPHLWKATQPTGGETQQTGRACRAAEGQLQQSWQKLA